ncbi:uncharacterized protein BDR25DRAFT_381212 [Lindgomyces ingoldianus]|uniref:Uncharacterized protein n=1 Tax=Lindgomyces ingoldianus TaxID=673940 RepID=A0ACB6QDG5_9PLEO|nr:uncharacterized protein BDR25DRAFT_381212 [Lindgomyces ingoldianus]KAF2464412.1 hypothetical protein BDR25DRAFT_381212 [Lindgomyces ingoldianus]
MSPTVQKEDLVTPIAVVGMSFRGPGDATNTDGLLRMVAEGRESRARIPKQKWNNDAFYHPDGNRYGTHNVEYGHWFQQDVYEFDAPFFNISAPEAAALDPQQRMLLECSYEALENAGIPMSKVVGTDTSVFTACFCTDYTDMLWRDPESVAMYQCTNSAFSRANMANRVSYSFDLKGPSITVDTACSGGLSALHLGCQSLLSGDASQAIVSGASVILGPEAMVTMSMMKFLSPDGRCYTFDERANGYARGEGIAVLILKRLGDALRDGDTVRAVIRGTSSNQDGKTPGITLPNGQSQESLIRSVYQKTGLDPLETSYVECHGTGTQAGDTTETAAISKIFNPGRKLKDSLVLGSVKTNIGHLEAASGLAGVIKSILMLENGVILPQRNFEKANPRIPLKEWNLRVPTTVEAWTCLTPRRASLNSFGYGGANVHAILESAEDYLMARGIDAGRYTRRSALAIKAIQDTLDMGGNGIPNGNVFTKGHLDMNGFDNGSESDDPDSVPQLFVLSAFDSVAGDAWAGKLADYVSQRPDRDDAGFLQSLAFTLSDRRTIHPWKAIVAASSGQDLISRLKAVKFTNNPPPKNLGFVFTGQGAQWCGMGKELICGSPRFRKSLELCGAAVRQVGASFDVLDELQKDFHTSHINKAMYSQTLCTAVQIALVDMLESWGVRPDCVTGHSSGEIAAAYAVGALSLEDAMLVAYARGCASTELAKAGVKGAMAAVGMGRDDLIPILSSLQSGKAVIACSNSPSSITVSGDKAALDELHQVLRTKGVYNRKLIVEVAYHSHHMALVADSYRNAINNIKVLEGNGVKFFSSLTGKQSVISKLDADYWVSNMVGEVKFAQSLRQMANRGGSDSNYPVQTLVEMGPHAALAGPSRQVLEADETLTKSAIEYWSVLVRKKDAVATALELASNLFMAGKAIRMAAVNQHAECGIPPLIDLPSYAWNHTKSYTAESRISRAYRERPFPRVDLLGVLETQSSMLEPRWRNYIRLSEIPWVRDHMIQSSIVYPAGGYISMAVEAARQRIMMRAAGTQIVGYQFRDVHISSALVIPDEPGEVEVVITLKPFSESVRSPSSLWDEFCISSVSRENRWTEHCRGLIAVRTPSKTSNPVNGQAHDESEKAAYKELAETYDGICVNSTDVAEFYEHLHQIGMDYGPTFANICSIRSGRRECIAEIQIPDTAAGMPMQFEHDFVIHPAVVDSIFQTFLPVLEANLGNLQDAVIPVSIEDMYIAHGLTRQPGKTLNSYTATTPKDYRFTSATMTVFEGSYTSGSKPVVHVGEITLAALDRHEAGANDNTVPSRALNMNWAPEIDALTEQQVTAICTPPTATEASMPIQLNEAVLCLLWAALAKVPEQKSVSAGEYPYRLWKWMHSQAEQSKVSREDNAIGGDEVFGEVGPTVRRIAQILPDLLVGERSPADLGKEYDLDAVSATPGLFENNQPAASYLYLLAHKKPDLSILTLGPQSGPASLNLLSLLTNLGHDTAPFTTFHFTDTEFDLDEIVKAKFPAWAESVAFKGVNAGDGGVLEDVNSRGVNDAYDVVVAFNVHNSGEQLSKTLTSTFKMIKPGGRLVLVNNAVHSAVATILWGPMPSFLSSQSDHWADLSSSAVDAVIRQTGYTTHAVLSRNRKPYDAMFLRTAATHEVMGQVKDALIVVDDEQPGIDLGQLQRLCEKRGIATHTVPLEHADPKPDQACIVLSDLTKHVLAAPRALEWEAIKRIALGGAGLLWVTRGAGVAGGRGVDPEASLIYGFARTIRAETGDRPVVTLDLDSCSNAIGTTAAAVIADLFSRTIASAGNNDAAECEFAERGGVLHVPRLVEDVDASEQLQAENRPQPSQGVPSPHRLDQTGSSRLLVGTPGLLDSLHFAPDERVEGPLGVGQVEVEVRAAGINFKDVMMSMGQIPVENLGCECAGVVVSVGSAVESDPEAPSIGDRVMCLSGGSFCTRLRVDARLVLRLPDSLSFETASALPITYVTAYHSIHNIARLRRGETILIHAAAGGLGQALVQLSMLAGGDIFVTVGSVEKKKLVMEQFGLLEERILYSRDTSFAADIMRLTHHRGVDVVMNSLAGEALRESWECIAPYGRFVELGQRDITIKSRLDMAPFARNASFTAYNLAYTLRNDPSAVREVMAKVLALYTDGRVRGPSPLETYPFSQLEQAFRRMQTGRHMGKLVAVVQGHDVVKFAAAAAGRPLLRPDAAYMLVGGLGGLGRATAMWMAARGARHLIFLNRSGPDSEAARETVAALHDAGCSTVVFACDVADAGQLTAVLDDARRRFPPIRGVVQGAMVLRDAMLDGMKLEDYSAVLRPKVQGTWNLHACLPEDLDFFVMESSISGIVGNTAQAAYAAANTFLDAFALYRRERGLPATTVDIGAVAGIGYLARNDALRLAMERQGFDFTDESRLMRLLEFAIRHSEREPRQAHIVTGLGAWHPDTSLPALRGPVFSRYRIMSSFAGGAGNSDDTLRRALKQAPSLDAAVAIILGALVEHIVSRTGIPPENVSPAKSLQDYGIDSLAAVELRNWLSKEMESTVPIFELLGAESLAILATEIAGRSRLIITAYART